jgi:hypothetical protein
MFCLWPWLDPPRMLQANAGVQVGTITCAMLALFLPTPPFAASLKAYPNKTGLTDISKIWERWENPRVSHHALSKYLRNSIRPLAHWQCPRSIWVCNYPPEFHFPSVFMDVFLWVADFFFGDNSYFDSRNHCRAQILTHGFGSTTGLIIHGRWGCKRYKKALNRPFLKNDDWQQPNFTQIGRRHFIYSNSSPWVQYTVCVLAIACSQ